MMQELGPKRGTALGVAVHAVSQAPLPGTNPPRREVGLTALVSVVKPADSRDPQRYPGRYRGYVQRLVNQIGQADREHAWHVVAAKGDALGKLICEEAKTGAKKIPDEHD